jgi:hypothetical protein
MGRGRVGLGLRRAGKQGNDYAGLEALKPVLTDKPASQKKDSRSGDRAEQAYNTMYDQSPYSQDEEKNAQSSYMDYSAVRHDMTAAHEPAAMA